MVRPLPQTLLVLATLQGCWIAARQSLRYEDVSRFSVSEVGSSPTTLRISGLAFHSALVVEKIGTRVEGTSLNVEAQLVSTREGLSGSFSTDIRVPDEVTVVTFGPTKVPIWKRS